MVTAVINPVLFHVKDQKNEYVLHHDHLKPCADRVVPLWLHRMHHNMLDLDTTIAYNEAEQDEGMPSSTPLFLPESSEVLDNPCNEPDLVTPPICQFTDSDDNNLGKGDNLEPGSPSSQPLVSSFGDTKVKEVTDLFLGH